MDYTFSVREPRERVGYITIGGKIGASAASELDKLLLLELEADWYSDVVLDCRGIEYISSAGLQVIMRAIQVRKRAKKPKLIFRVAAGSLFQKMLVSVGLSDYVIVRT